MIRNFRLNCILPCLLGIALTAPGCRPTGDMGALSPADQAPNQVVAQAPALWRVADEDTTVYLFGTVHILPKGVDWFKDDIADALASSDALVTEIYVTEDEKPLVAQAFMTSGTLPAGENLRDMMGPDARLQYELALKKLSMPISAFDRYEPWYAALNLSLIPLFQQGYTDRAGVESVIEAKAAGKKRIQLESYRYQAEMLDGLPLDSQLRYLASVAGDIDAIVPTLDQLVLEWASGDTEGIDALMNVDYGDDVLADALFASRNRKWAAWIDERLDTPGTVFFAVGAGHLAGDKSVQAVLAQRGIKTVRLQ